MIYCCFN